MGGMDTALPEEVDDKMKALLAEYNSRKEKTFEDIVVKVNRKSASVMWKGGRIVPLSDR